MRFHVAGFHTYSRWYDAERCMFEKMDTNHDGSLSVEEIDAGHAKMMMKKTD